MSLILLILTWTSEAGASCVEQREQAANRTVISAGIVGAPGAITSSLAVVNTIGIALRFAGGDPVNPAGGQITFGMWLFAVPELSTGWLILQRTNSLNRASALVGEAQLGDGPALRALAADMGVETGLPWTVEELGHLIVSLDGAGAFCDPLPMGLYGVKRTLLPHRP